METNDRIETDCYWFVKWFGAELVNSFISLKLCLTTIVVGFTKTGSTVEGKGACGLQSMVEAFSFRF